LRGGIVLSGGISQRMGRDKGLTLLNGKALVAWATEAVMKVAGEVVVVVSSRQNRESYAQVLPKSIRIICDELDQQCPLVGMLTGLSALRSQYAVVATCDQPFITPSVLNYLFEATKGVDCVVPRWSNGRAEFLQTVYLVASSKLAAQQALDEGQLRSRALAKRLNKVKYVPVEELKSFDENLLTFFNVNTPDDLVKAEQISETYTGK